MSNTNILNTTNWYTTMSTNNTLGTKVSVSGTNPDVQATLISTANNVNFCYYKYPLQKTQGFTLTFQLYITASNINSVCAAFGITTPSFDGNGGVPGQSGAVEMMIKPSTNTFNLYTNYGTNTIAYTATVAFALNVWKTFSVTFTPSATNTWLITYDGNTITYNDSSYTNFVNNPNTLWGIYGGTSNASPVYLRQVNMNVNLSNVSLTSLKNDIYDYPEQCFVNKLSTYSQNNCTAAFSTRLLISNYTGPMLNIRRGSDDATQDFYGDINGTLGTTFGGNGLSLIDWLNSATGYVTTIYDQSGFGRNVIQTTTSQQPTIGPTSVLNTISSAAKTSTRGAYTLFRVNTDYTGPTINIRRSSDNATLDFYADTLGNMGSSINATGTSFASWIGSNTAYVTTWYDQSGNGFHAVQATTTAQPVYNNALNLIDFLTDSARYLTINTTSVLPSGNSAFTFVAKHGTFTSNGVIIGNNFTGSRTNSSLILGASNYTVTSASNDTSFGTKPVSDNTVVLKFDGTNRYGYVNDELVGTIFGTYNVQASPTTIGYNSTYGTYLNGKLHYLYIFGKSLSDADRFICTNPRDTTNILYDGTKVLYNTTNVPITANNDNYSYVTTYIPRTNGFSVIVEQASNPIVNNTRAAFMISNSNSLYFAGHNNDVNMNKIGYNTPRKTVVMYNHNLSTGNVVLNDNGTMYSYTTSSPSTLALAASTFCIGRNASGSEFYTGNINEIIVFNNTLTTHESMLYYTPNLITRKDYTSRPKFQIKGIPKNNSPLPSGAIIELDSQMLSNFKIGATLTSWGNTGATAYNLPVYTTAPGTSSINLTQSPYVTLASASSQYIDCGSKTFNINTNGGFTVVCYAKFNSLITHARIFDFGNGSTDNNILVGIGTSNAAYFNIYNGSTLISSPTSATGFFTTNWQVYTFRYTVSSNLVEFIKDGVLVTSTTITTAATNRTITSSRIGRSHWADPYSNINIAGLYAYDKALTDTQIAAISNHLAFSTTSSLPSVIPDYNKINIVGSVLSNGYRQNQATFFNGNINSYIDVQDVPAPPMSYCFWFWNTSTNGIGNGNTMVGLCDFLRGTNYGIQIDTYNNNTLNFYCALPSTWTTYTGYPITANTWYHVTVCVTTSFSVIIYVNGSLLTTLTGTTTPVAKSRFIVGADGTNARGSYGYIYDFRVYDYILRADEITPIFDQSEKYLLSYTSPENYLVNVRNWYSIMTQQAVNNWGGGSYTGYTMVQSVTDPNVQLQMGVSTITSANIIYNQTAIQNYSSFTCSFEIYTSAGIGNCIYFFVGGTGFPGKNADLDCYVPPNGFTVQFEAYNGLTPQGINIINSKPSLVASYPTTAWINAYTWNSVTISYTRGITNTWVINFNDQDVITYSDPNNAMWLANAGNYWGIGANNQGATMNSYIRRLELNYKPYSSNIGQNPSNGQSFKFPIAALTSNSTTIAGNGRGCGTYITSASSNDGNPAYYSFQNSTTSPNGFWHNIPGYNPSTGVYTGGVTTTVSGISYAGEWIQIQLPNTIQLASFNIYPRQDQTLYATRSPRKFVVAGSNDGTTWYALHIATGINDWTAAEKSFSCNQGNYDKFSYFRMVVQEAGNTTNNGGYINFANLSLFASTSLDNAKTPRGLIDGLTWKIYNGWISNVNLDNLTYFNIGRCTNTADINRITNGQYITSAFVTYATDTFGYFRPNITGTWSFRLWGNDVGYFWLGANALSGYTTSNHNIVANLATGTASISLTAGVYYPIRIRHSQQTGANDLQLGFTPPGGSELTNGQGYYFSSIGTNQAYPAESAKVIKDLTDTNTDGVYYINVNGTSTPVHCLMNDHYDGGGWMMLMKATRGTTFQYSANYWTTQNTLNAGDTTRLDGDAKFDTFNYSQIKDVLAIWPDISPNSYTNIYGKNGGSMYCGEGWTWKVDNWNGSNRTTALAGFQNPRDAHPSNPFVFNGFSSTLWSNQTGAYRHVFGGSSHMSGSQTIRWGLLFNNETDFNSIDVESGIGFGDSRVNYSAGDYYYTAGNSNLNRSARVEMYGR